MPFNSKSAQPGPHRSAGARRALQLLAALLGMFALGPLAGAQERPPEIAVLHTATDPQPGAATLPLSIFFSLRDQNGNIVPRSVVSLDGAQGSLIVAPAAGQPFPPVPISVGDPQTPIKIALVIDRSGSMNQRIGEANGQPLTLFEAVRTAAIESLKSAPQQAEFAVFSFAEKPELQSAGFLSQAEQSQLIQDAILRFAPNKPGTGNTCITDAALAAIDFLNANKSDQALERKAVILFTDGIDKEADNSPTNGNNCSNLDFDAVIRSAQLSSGTIIPLYTIWPCTEPCDENQRAGLEKLARETRGASAIGSLQDSGALFQRVMELLNSQWVLKADVLASKGQNTATLRVQLGDDGTFLTAATPFESDRDYNPLPVIAVAQQQYSAEDDRYKVTLGITNPDGVGEVIAGVYNLDSGGVLVSQEQRFDKLGPLLEFFLPTDGLKAGETYFLRITAQDKNKNPLQDAKGGPLLISYEFKYEPKLNYSIGAVTPEWEAGSLLVAVDVRGAGERPLSFTGEITNRDKGDKEALAATSPREGQLRFPLPKLLRDATQPASYEITLRLEDGENGLERRREPPVTIEPQVQPGFLTVFINSPAGPVVLGLLGVALLGAIGGLIYMRTRPQKREIPLPFNPQTMLRPSPGEAAQAVPTPRSSAVAPAQVKIPPPVKVSLPPVAPPTEVRSSRQAAPPTVVSGPSSATVVHMPEQRRPRVRIKVVKTVDPTQVREQIFELPCSIGREQATFVITGDPKISRLHAELRADGDQLLLVDLGSTNGTLVRDKQLENKGSVALESPSVVGIGPNTTLEVELK